MRKSDAQIEGMVSIFNYGFDVAEKAFKDAGVMLESLTSYAALLELTKEKKFISEETEQLLLKWRLNPSEWQAVANK